MKKFKALLVVACALLLVAASVFGTMAYLTSKDTVTNTFTIGKVEITLDEAKVDLNGTAVTPDERVKNNSYKLMPGHSYTKDPTVHVDAASEDSWIFVKVENGIAAFEAATSSEEGGYKKIADQIVAKGWTALDGVAGVYYKSYDKSTTGANLVVFENFKMADNANEVNGWGNISADTTKVTVTAYAVQKDGFATANAAWTETFGKPAGN